MTAHQNTIRHLKYNIHAAVEEHHHHAQGQGAQGSIAAL
jgi:hypothetical protein